MGEFEDKLKGKAKQVEGSVTGDRTKQLEGFLDELKGKAKEKFEAFKHAIRRDENKYEKDDHKYDK